MVVTEPRVHVIEAGARSGATAGSAISAARRIGVRDPCGKREGHATAPTIAVHDLAFMFLLDIPVFVIRLISRCSRGLRSKRPAPGG